MNRKKKKQNYQYCLELSIAIHFDESLMPDFEGVADFRNPNSDRRMRFLRGYGEQDSILCLRQKILKEIGSNPNVMHVGSGNFYSKGDGWTEFSFNVTDRQEVESIVEYCRENDVALIDGYRRDIGGKNDSNIPNILIVEDQAPLEGLIEAVEQVFPRQYSGFSRSNYAVAECYNEARDLISSNAYDILILDHRLPLENQSELQKKDFMAFSDTLQNIGYSLIPLIKERNPNAVVIGTSSLSRDELRRFHSPDFKLDKVTMQVSEDLDKIVLQVKERSGGSL